MTRPAVTGLALAAALLSAPALAQAPQPSPQTALPAPSNGDRTASGVPRSGVIAPPVTGAMPQADVPAERPNSTPVIPPPGTPGGNPAIQPR